MFRVFAFLTKREGLGIQEFIDYYEQKHIPLILRLAPAPLIYKRRYLMRDQETDKEWQYRRLRRDDRVGFC